MDTDSIFTVAALLFLVLLSAYFSATEMAFASLSRVRVKGMAEGGSKRAALVMRLLDDYPRLLTTILIGNNIVNITAAAIATMLFTGFLPGNLGVTVSTITVTLAVLVFGDISPKSLAKESPERFALLAAPLINFLAFILFPLSFVFIKFQGLISRRFNIAESRPITEEELLTLVEEAEQEGSINEEDRELITNVFDFNDRKASDILTPRVDVAGVELTAPAAEISEMFIATGFTRLAVFEGSLDNITGFLHLRDHFESVLKGGGSVAESIKPVVYASASMRITDLLRLLQGAKSHLAVVTDEYGGTAGIVTMEDILEELVGDIWDEHDEVIEEIKPIGENTYRVLCGTDAHKLFEFFGVDAVIEAPTVSGWIAEILGRIPEEGDSFEAAGLAVTVTKTEHRRALECVVTPTPSESESDGGDSEP